MFLFSNLKSISSIRPESSVEDNVLHINQSAYRIKHKSSPIFRLHRHYRVPSVLAVPNRNTRRRLPLTILQLGGRKQRQRTTTERFVEVSHRQHQLMQPSLHVGVHTPSPLSSKKPIPLVLLVPHVRRVGGGIRRGADHGAEMVLDGSQAVGVVDGSVSRVVRDVGYAGQTSVVAPSVSF